MGILDDRAEKAGASKWTVLRALDEDREYSHTGAKKRAVEIRQIAKKMGYRPNAAARAVARGRFDAIGLLIPHTESGVFLPFRLMRSILVRAREHDFHLSVDEIPTEKLTSPDYIPTILKKLSVDGLVLDFIGTEEDAMVDLISNFAIPSVWTNNRRDTDSSFPDDLQGGRLAAEHLISLGHRRIAYIHRPVTQHYSIEERNKGYTEAMRTNALEPRVTSFSDESDMDDIVTSLLELLRSPTRPTAFIANGHQLAFAAAMAARTAGFSIPEDISLVVFETRQVTLGSTEFSTMIIPMGRTGSSAVDMLVAKIKKPRKKIPSVRVPYHQPRGNTCAGPPE